MDKVKSLTIALVVVVIAAIALVGVSYSRQKDAENKLAILGSAVSSATNLDELKDVAAGLVAYSGAGVSADAARMTSSQGGLRCYVAERGDDAGREWCEDASSSDWWNPFSW